MDIAIPSGTRQLRVESRSFPGPVLEPDGQEFIVAGTEAKTPRGGEPAEGPSAGSQEGGVDSQLCRMQ